MKLSIILLILIVLTGYGCAAKKLAIKNADYLLSHQITKRLPLYSEQKDELAKDIDKLLNNSKTEAQEILPIVDEIDLDKKKELKQNYTKLENYIQTLSGHFSELLSKYMAKLDSKQQKEMFETLDDENREILKIEKEKSIDKIEERIEKFLGSVNSKQKQLVRENSDYFVSRSKERLDRRVRLHENFKAIYKMDISEASRATSFKESFEKYQSEALLNNKNLELLVKLLPTISKDQKEHFRKIVGEVKEMLKYFISTEY